MMKKKRPLSVLILLFVCLLAAAVPSHAAVPRYVSFQGNLQDSSGNSLTGSYDFKFEIFFMEQGGEPGPWLETQVGVQVTNGLYGVSLGANNPLTLAFDRDYWLEISVKPSLSGSYEKLSPRQRLTSSPYAFRSEYTNNAASAAYATTAFYATSAGSVGGDIAANTVGAYQIIDSTITPVKLSTGSYEHIRAGTATIAYALGSGNYLNDVKVSSAVYADSAGNATLAQNSVGSYHIIDATITANDIRDNAITPVKVSTAAFEHVRVGTATIATAVAFNYAASSSKGGPATSLATGAYEQIRAGTATIAYALADNNYDLSRSTFTFYKVTVSSWINPGSNVTIGGDVSVNGKLTYVSTISISMGGYVQTTVISADTYDSHASAKGLGFTWVDFDNLRIVKVVLEIYYNKPSVTPNYTWQLWDETNGQSLATVADTDNSTGDRLATIQLTGGAIPNTSRKLRVRLMSDTTSNPPPYFGSCIRLFTQ
ncbi:MAG: hypothetical protein ACYC5N_08850 [Endomicrobiales bacterium]